jgi:hypothetical protein
MRVLVACEFSGRVRDAFIRRGHDAVSCDLLPSESSFGPHYQCDVRQVLGRGWDMMIAFPPCIYLASSGIHWNSSRPGRAEKTEEALAFVRLLLEASTIPRIALENPIGLIGTCIRKPDQIIHPWQHGHDEAKATCIWLKGLPLLVPSLVIPIPRSGHRGNQTASGQNRLGPSQDRSKLRSLTYLGVANAMADQWGSVDTL